MARAIDERGRLSALRRWFLSGAIAALALLFAAPWAADNGVGPALGQDREGTVDDRACDIAPAACRFLADALATAHLIDGPDSRAFALVIVGRKQAELGLAERSVAVFEAARTVVLDMPAEPYFRRQLGPLLSDVAVGLASLGYIEDAQALVRLLPERSSSRVEAQIAVAVGHARRGRVDEARDALDAFDSAYRDEALGKAAAAAAGADLMADAMTWAMEIRDAAGRSRALAHIASHQARAGLAGEARRNFGDALAIAFGWEDPYLRASLLESIVEAQSAAGMFDDALATARVMGDSFFKDVALDAVSRDQARAGDFAGAYETARAIGAPLSHLAAVINAARVAADAGRVDEAWAMLRESQGAIALISPRLRPGALAEIAAVQVRLGEQDAADRTFAAALAAAREIEAEDDRDTAIAHVAIAFASAGLLDAAFETAGDPPVGRYTVLKMARASIEAGLVEEARAIYADAIAAALASADPDAGLRDILDSQIAAADTALRGR